MSWIPMYSGIVDSSLWDLPDAVIKVFFTLLAEKGPGDIYNKTTYALARAARKTEAEVEAALKVLSEPDALRPGQENDGRRIQRVEGGWFIINAAFYRKMMSEELRRYRNAKAQKAWRERQAQAKAGALPGEAAYVKALERGDEKGAERIVEASLPEAAKKALEKEAAVVPAAQPPVKPVVPVVQKPAPKVSLSLYPPAPSG